MYVDYLLNTSALKFKLENVFFILDLHRHKMHIRHNKVT